MTSLALALILALAATPIAAIVVIFAATWIDNETATGASAWRTTRSILQQLASDPLDHKER